MPANFSFPKEFAPNPFYASTPLAHEVPIATVRNDLYVLSDYSFVAVFRVKGAEYEMSNTDETIAFVHGLKSVLNSLRQKVHFKLLYRVTHNYKDWLDEHLSLLDGEQLFARYVAWDQAKHFYDLMQSRQLLRSENLVVLTYKAENEWWKTPTPETLKSVFMQSLDKAKIVQKRFSEYNEMIKKFEDIINPTVKQMSLIGLEPHRLKNSELYQLAWETLNPRTSLRQSCPEIKPINHRIDGTAGFFATNPAQKVADRRPDVTVIAPLSERERLCVSDWVVKEDYVYADGAYYGAISLRMLPTHVYPTMAAQLIGLPYECTISIDCTMLQKKKELDKQWKETRMAESMADASKSPDPADKEMAADKRKKHLQLLSAFENPFRVRMVIVFSGETPDELNKRSDTIVSLLQSISNTYGIRERFGVDTLIKSTWPFAIPSDINSRKAFTSHISYMLPLFSRWEGSRRAVTLFMDRLGRLVRHDPFPKNQQNKNRTICGASGSGKSFCSQLADVQPHAARKGTEVLIVESGGSFELTTRCFDGINIRLGPRSNYYINPFDLPEGFDDMPPEDQETELRYKYGFIKNLVLGMARISSVEDIMLAENVVGIVTQRTYASVKIPRFRDFYRILGQYSNVNDPQAEKLAKRLQTLLANYVVNERNESGIYSHYFDCFTNFDSNSTIICFDLIDVKNDPALLGPMTMVVILGLIYNRLMKRDGKERLVVIDEAWALIKEGASGEQSPAGQGIELFWREGRKLGASSTLISQSYSDMSSDKVGRAVVNNSTIQYFLVHERAASNDIAFRGASFSAEKINKVYELKTEYGEYSEIMIKEGQEWGVVRLPSSGIRYWLATTDPEDMKVRNRFEDTYGKGYGLNTDTVVALLAANYPAGTHGEKPLREMTEQESLTYASQFKKRLETFSELIKKVDEKGKPIPVPFDF